MVTCSDPCGRTVARLRRTPCGAPAPAFPPTFSPDPEDPPSDRGNTRVEASRTPPFHDPPPRTRHRPAAHARPNFSLVHSSRGRNARTHEQPGPVGAKSRGQSARKRRTLVMAAEREGWRRAPPARGMFHADIRRWTSAWPPLACVPANRLSAHRETFPRSGVSV